MYRLIVTSRVRRLFDALGRKDTDVVLKDVTSASTSCSPRSSSR